MSTGQGPMGPMSDTIPPRHSAFTREDERMGLGDIRRLAEDLFSVSRVSERGDRILGVSPDEAIRMAVSFSIAWANYLDRTGGAK